MPSQQLGLATAATRLAWGQSGEAVIEHVPHGEVLCAELGTDVLLPVGVSNWGCYAIDAALAILTGKAELAHSAVLERRMIEASPMIGLIDGKLGKLQATVDGMPIEVHVGIVELLAEVVRSALAS